MQQWKQLINNVLLKRNETGAHTVPASPVSASRNLFKWRLWAFGKVLPAPVNQKLFGSLASPASSSIVKVSYVLGLLLVYCNAKQLLNASIGTETLQANKMYTQLFLPQFKWTAVPFLKTNTMGLTRKTLKTILSNVSFRDCFLKCL